jgi:hypothetical protein
MNPEGGERMFLNMSQKERDRLQVLSRVKMGELSLWHGAELLGLSYRQCSRYCRVIVLRVMLL